MNIDLDLLPSNTDVLNVGSFASADNKLGIGKITNTFDTEVELEYFLSISEQRRDVLSRSKVQPSRVPPQTRCYVKTEECWRMGRVMKSLNGQVEVDFPEGHSEFLPLQDVYVRCALPIDNPTDVLANWGHETVFFYQRRKWFMEGLLRQRSVSGGLNGLLSSSIQFMKHQVEAAREVLEDPVRRYMLADEVGLGKTIESGIIIRQTLLDKPEANVLIIAPASLLDQWREEMEGKFHISQWPGQISFVSYEDCKNVTSGAAFDLVVIDEAHHMAENSISEDEKEKSIFAACKQLAHQSPGLLLLSATPALHHEKAFLCLLNLLDPKHFPLDKEEEFIDLIAKREVIAKVLLGFSEQKPNILIKNSLRRLFEIFSNDEEIQVLTQALSQCLNEQTVDEEERNKLINKTRTLISERYRIHRRIIRHRRNQIWDIQRSKPKEDFADDERENEVLTLLNDWRLRVLAFSTAESSERAQYQHCYFLMLAAFYSSLDFFKMVVAFRLSQESSSIIDKEFSETEKKALRIPHFDEESSLLGGMLSALDRDDEAYTRESLLVDCLSMLGDNANTKKVVVFTSFSWVADSIAERLQSTLKDGTVLLIKKSMSRQEIHENISLFKESETHWVLVSDRVGEEGLNLQFANTLIHFDLPWSANQLEQRIGRLDRIGQQSKIRSFVFLGTEEEELVSPVILYYKFLKEALSIFEQSVNAVQFIIEAVTTQFKHWIFEEFGDLNENKVISKISSIKQEVEAEMSRIHGQDLLDESISNRKGNSQFFEKLMESEEDPSLIYKEFNPWIKDALMFKANGRTSYSWTTRTLVPLDILTKNLYLNKEFSGSYYRSQAAESALPPFRIGNFFIDVIADYISWDDRGKAFAIWRRIETIQNDWKGFKFDLIVEANVDASLDPYVRKALQRKADSLFPPKVYTVFIELASAEAEQDNLILSHLEKPIFKDGYDENLTKEKAVLLRDQFTNFQWKNYCQKAFHTVHSSVTSAVPFLAQKEDSLKAAKQYIHTKEEQLKIHQDHTFHQQDQSKVEAALNQLLLFSIESPTVKVDAVGFIWLSNTKLSEVLEVDQE